MTDFDIDAILDQAAQPERTLQLCLRGDLRAEWDELDRQLAEARKRDRTSLSDDGGEATARRMTELEGQMRESTVTFRLRAMSRRAWKKLIESHPPKTDADKKVGIAADTFYDALIAACVVEPEMSTEQLGRMFDVITSGQYDELAEACWMLNRRDVDVPFSPTASRITKNSGETSRRRSGSGSATGDGRAGSRKKSSSTNTTKKAASSDQ